MSMSWIMRVHDHRVVLDARDEWPEPPGLDEDGLLHDLPQLLHGAVEPLDVADVEDAALLARHPEELLRFFQGRRHGLLHEDVHAGLEEVARDLEMPLGGDGHGGDVHESRELAMAGHRACPVLGGDLAPRAASASQMATRSTSHSSARARIWYCPMCPAPTTPARRRPLSEALTTPAPRFPFLPGWRGRPGARE